MRTWEVVKEKESGEFYYIEEVWNMRALPLEFRMAWGYRLREAIREVSLTIPQFAEKCGYSENRVYKWLAGTVPEIPEIKALAEHLGKPPGWLLFGDVSPSTSKKKTIRALGALIGIGLLVGGTWAPHKAWAQPVGQVPTEMQDYVRLRPRRWPWVVSRRVAHRLHPQKPYARPHRRVRSRMALAA